MVKTNGCRGNKLHLRAFEQGAVATGTGADNECIGTPHLFGSKACPVEIYHLGKLFKNPFEEGNGSVGYNFHHIE